MAMTCLPGVTFKRAVLIGCTNGGTHLADAENVKDLLDTYTNLFARASSTLGSLGGPTGITIGKALSTSVSLLGKFAQAIADAAIEDKAVPGLAAMRPGGDAVNALNGSQNPGSDGTAYFAISANFEPRFNVGAGIAKETAELLIDRVADRLFKSEANDLVVDTVAMTALGTLSSRLADEHVFPFGETDRVYHITYFAQPEVAEKLTLWLGLAAAPQAEPEAVKVAPPPVSFEAPPPVRRMRGGPGRTRLRSAPGSAARPKAAADESAPPAKPALDAECHFAARDAAKSAARQTHPSGSDRVAGRHRSGRLGNHRRQRRRGRVIGIAADDRSHRAEKRPRDRSGSG